MLKAYFSNSWNEITKLSDRRDISLENLKGFIMILVVMGHLTTGSVIPHENIWYENLKQFIYSFHMPLFFALSGIIFFIQIENINKKTNKSVGWLSYIFERTNRLLIPFLAMGVVITMGKFLLQPPPELGQAPMDLSSGLLTIFINTEQSPTRFIWFLFTLYVLSILIFPLITSSRNKNLLIFSLLFMALLVLFFLTPKVPDILYLNRLSRHAVFFIVGLFIASNFDYFKNIFKSILPFSILIFALLGSIAISYLLSNIERFLLVAFISVAVFIPLSSCFYGFGSIILRIIGKYSFVIFLFNLIFIGVAKMIILKIFGWSGTVFNFSVFFIFFSGIIGPIIFKVFFLKYIPTLDRYTN